MTLSNITPLTPIPVGSAATVGLFNRQYQAVMDNVNTLNAGAFSGGSVVVQSIDSGGKMYDIRAFGASIANTPQANRLAIRSAISAAYAARGGQVYFPPSRWTVDEALPCYGGVEFVGSGWSSELASSGTSVTLVTIYSQGRVADLRLVGSNTSFGINRGLNGGGTNWARVERVWFDQMGGCAINFADDSNYNTVEDCRFTNSWGEGILCNRRSNYNTVRNCYFSGNSMTPIDFLGSGNAAIGNYIENINYSGSDDWGVLLNAFPEVSGSKGANEQSVILNNRIINAGSAGIQINSARSAGVTGALIIGNTISRTSGPGIGDGLSGSVSTCEGLLIKGNSVVSCSEGILLSGAERCTIEGNDVSHCSIHGIRIATFDSTFSAAFNRIIGNSVRSNGSWGIYLYDSRVSATDIINNYVWDNGGAIKDSGTRTRSVGNRLAPASGNSWGIDNIGTGTGDFYYAGTNNAMFMRYVDAGVQEWSITNNAATRQLVVGVSTGVVTLPTGPLITTAGSTTTPAIGFSSETSLGFYRPGAATMALTSSNYTFNLNQSRLLSIRTQAASNLTLSAANGVMRADEAIFTIGGASGASFAIHSGGTVYLFESTKSAKAT